MSSPNDYPSDVELGLADYPIDGGYEVERACAVCRDPFTPARPALVLRGEPAVHVACWHADEAEVPA